MAISWQFDSKKSRPKSPDVIFEAGGPYYLLLTRDPDFHPTENLSNVIKSKLVKGSMKQNIFRETFDVLSLVLQSNSL